MVITYLRECSRIIWSWSEAAGSYILLQYFKLPSVFVSLTCPNENPRMQISPCCTICAFISYFLRNARNRSPGRLLCNIIRQHPPDLLANAMVSSSLFKRKLPTPAFRLLAAHPQVIPSVAMSSWSILIFSTLMRYENLPLQLLQTLSVSWTEPDEAIFGIYSSVHYF